ncbi:alpha/beta hydrolase [Altererythrobacter aquiaggeris]|uniref:alpha/beta fold hydrolase n=1 Tax=Aestuarierythrobacter aquiaggeris TaxID=1898396 RepID=UPI003018824B
MKLLGKTLAVLIGLLFLAFLIFRTPDTDPQKMRAKYGGEPSQFLALEDGLTVHFRDEGPENAPVIMLLHGSSADLHTWQPWVDALKDDYRVIRFDQIGHGLTGPAPDDNYEMAAFTGTITQVADRLGLKKFILGGNSMGGGIAMAYALENPDRLDGLVLVDASGAPVKRDTRGGGNLAYKITAIPGLRNLMTQITPRSLIEQSYARSVYNQDIVTPEAVDRYWEMLRYPGNRAATLKRFDVARVPFTSGQAEGMRVPTLVMWGEEDSLIPFAASAWFTRHIPNSAEVSYPQIGHLPMEETPDRSANDLREWLATLSLTKDPV